MAIGLLLCLIVLASARARAELDGFSAFERDVVAEAFSAYGEQIEPNPEGKRIEGIRIVTLEVFDHRDPVPDFVNYLHGTTQRAVVERELLFARGETYDQLVVDETARNLRALRQLSLVVLVPARGSSDDSVRVVVITKDVWSLRLNMYFEAEGAELSYLLLSPMEENLAGTHTSLGGAFELERERYSAGLLYIVPRLAGSRLMARAGLHLIVNRESGAPEGSAGNLLYAQPLYSTQAEWAWAAAVVWRYEITRIYRGAEIRRFDAPSTPEAEQIPVVYRSDVALGGYELTRSYGERAKLDLTAGLEATRRSFRPLFAADVSPRAADEFRREELPVGDTRLGPVVQARTYTTDHVRLLDVDTLALQEDFRVGHDVTLRLYPASERFGSTRDMLGVFAGAAYTLPLADGIVRAVATTTSEVASRDRHDIAVTAALRVATPQLGFGRFVYDASLVHRYRNYQNRQSSLGANNRLRGYPADEFRGADALASNLELRTRSIEILSTYSALGLFYDVADAFHGFENLRPKQGAGLGLRILFPQMNRVVFRADWGFPLGSEEHPALPGSLYVSFGQAVPMPELATPGVPALFRR
jgi:hypothetical protein